MKKEFIKPIPKVILEKIFRLDLKEYPRQDKYPRFYSYLTSIKGELVKITVAVKNYYKKWCCKQVTVHGVKTEQCLIRDIKYYNGFSGDGYKVGWTTEGYTKTCDSFYFEQGWIYHKFDDCYNPYTITINPEFVEKYKEYKYSGYQHLGKSCIIAYLKIYVLYPQSEYLMKFGLGKFRFYVSILKRISNDKNFCKWLITHKDELAKSRYKIPVINKAYLTDRSLRQAEIYVDSWKGIKNNNSHFKPFTDMFNGNVDDLCMYLQNQDSDPSSYLDYVNACNYLRLDMSRPDNRFPSNFQRLHDRRIDEMNAIKERADREKRAELYKKFAEVAEKYLSLQNCKLGAYAVLIAKSPKDLIYEGEKLIHCVGKSGYEQQMVEEKTLIFFIRSVEQPDIPFVTVEYSLESNKVLQCYGYKSEKPEEPVLDFVNKVWLPYANRTIKKLCA